MSLRILKNLRIDAVFRIDALGALISACLVLFLIWPQPEIFGLEESICEGLGLVAAMFFGYSLSCSIWIENSVHAKALLGIISGGNSLYALALLVLLAVKWDSLGFFGLLYLSGEALLLFLLASQEWRYAKDL